MRYPRPARLSQCGSSSDISNMLLSKKCVAAGFVEAMDTGAAFDAAFSVIVHWDHNWQLHATELPPINTPFGSAWETNGFGVEPRVSPVPLWHAIRSLLATIALRNGCAPAYHATLARGARGNPASYRFCHRCWHADCAANPGDEQFDGHIAGSWPHVWPSKCVAGLAGAAKRCRQSRAGSS